MHKVMYNIFVALLCRCDGIGRRSGLKIHRWRQRTGSSPVTGTIKEKRLISRKPCGINRFLYSKFTPVFCFFPGRPLRSGHVQQPGASCNLQSIAFHPTDRFLQLLQPAEKRMLSHHRALTLIRTQKTAPSNLKAPSFRHSAEWAFPSHRFYQ